MGPYKILTNKKNQETRSTLQYVEKGNENTCVSRSGDYGGKWTKEEVEIINNIICQELAI